MDDGAGPVTAAFAWPCAVVCAAAWTLIPARSALAAERDRAEPQAAAIRARPFPLDSVRLLDGPFRRAQEADAAYLLKLEPDRLLSRFREYAGLKPRGEAYGGWERESLSGHSLGHYLSACAMMWQTTGDARFRDRVQTVVEELRLCQEAKGDGLVVGFPDARRAFAEVAAGDIRAKSFNLNGIWSPFYTLHKLFAGLRDAYRLCGSRTALEIESELGGWVERTLSGLSDAQMQQVLVCEFGGMNEVLVDLYADTGERRWLDLSRRFDHAAVVDPLRKREDRLNGLHANTQIPKFVGLARRHHLTGEPDDLALARFFWDRAVRHHSYVTGGNSESEYLGPPDQLNHRLSDRTTETCNTYNLLKLTRLLWMTEPSAGLADYYEQALVNHILASQNPATGMVTYFVPLRSGFQKLYTTPFDTFTCCLGTGMENHAKHADSIYFHQGDVLYVNLFVPSELNWRERGAVLRQETGFPDGDTTTLAWRCAAPVELAVRIRRPHWVAGPVELKINGEPAPCDIRPNGYIECRRTWRDGDRIDLRLPMSLRLWPMPDNPSRCAILHGPILLAGDLGPADGEVQGEPAEAPVLLASPVDPASWIRPVEGQPGVFRTAGVGRPQDVTLRPFYQIHGRRYAVYWDLLSPAEWNRRQEETRAEAERRRRIEARTFDRVEIGRAESEKDHQLQGDKMESEDYNGRFYRLSRGGWLSYELKLPPEGAASLMLTYWGGERPGSRLFDVQLNGRTIATVSLGNDHPDRFFDVEYSIPAELAGTGRITLRLESRQDKYAGGIFDCRILRHESETR